MYLDLIEPLRTFGLKKFVAHSDHRPFLHDHTVNQNILAVELNFHNQTISEIESAVGNFRKNLILYECVQSSGEAGTYINGLQSSNNHEVLKFIRDKLPRGYSGTPPRSGHCTAIPQLVKNVVEAPVNTGSENFTVTKSKVDGGCSSKQKSEHNEKYNLKRPACDLVINNIFNDPDNDDANYKNNYREGAESHTCRWMFLLKHLNCHVLSYDNVGKMKLEEIFEIFKIISKDYDSMIVVLMTHGGKKLFSFLMDDLSEAYLYGDIIKPFTPQEFPDGVNKPKIFLIQSCLNGPEDGLQDGAQTNRNLDNVLIGLATVPLKVANRHEYLNNIEQIFEQENKEADLVTMLKHVDEKMGAQTTTIINQGFHKDYFF